MSLARLLGVLLLLALSAALLLLVPGPEPTLAELTPADPLLFFEVTLSTFRADGSDGRILPWLTDEFEWPPNMLQDLPAVDRQLAQELADDPLTRLSVSVFNAAGGRDGVKVDFVLLAETSQKNFGLLAELATRSIRRAIPPGHYVELQQKPKLGVMVGAPPRRLYVYEDWPLYLVSNSPELVQKMLEVRYRGRPVLAGQKDFKRMRTALSGSRGAVLYIRLADLLSRSELVSSIPFLSIVRAANMRDLHVLGYHWDIVRGELVRRVILPGGE